MNKHCILSLSQVCQIRSPENQNKWVWNGCSVVKEKNTMDEIVSFQWLYYYVIIGTEKNNVIWNPSGMANFFSGYVGHRGVWNAVPLDPFGVEQRKAQNSYGSHSFLVLPAFQLDKFHRKERCHWFMYLLEIWREWWLHCVSLCKHGTI